MTSVIRAFNFLQPAVTEDAQEKIKNLAAYSTDRWSKTDFIEHSSVWARTAAIFAIALPVMIRALSSVIGWKGFISEAQLMSAGSHMGMRVSKEADLIRTLLLVASFPKPIFLGCILAGSAAWLTKIWQNRQAEDGVRELFVERFKRAEGVPKGVMEYLVQDPKAVACLVEKKAELTKQTQEPGNLLSYALSLKEQAKRNEVLSLLTQNGMTIPKEWFCAFVEKGNSGIIKEILEKKYVKVEDFTPQEQRDLWAVVSDREVAGLLIKHGFDINSLLEGSSDTALMMRLKEMIKSPKDTFASIPYS